MSASWLLFIYFLKDLLLATCVWCTDLQHQHPLRVFLFCFLRSVESQGPPQTDRPRSCVFTKSLSDLAGLTHQATEVVNSGIWQVLFSRLIIIGCSRSWASTVTTGLALQGENTGFQLATGAKGRSPPHF